MAALLMSAPSPHLVEGNPAAAVRVMIYEDLQCPDCAAFRRMLDDQLLPRYGAKVAFEHRDLPLAKHAWARKAALAARFFEQVRPKLAVAFRKHTLASLREITAANFEERLGAFAKQNGVDPSQALAGLQDERYAQLVEKDVQEGVARGVAKTPTVFVDGTPFIETFTLLELSQAIEAALAAAK